MRYIKLLVFAVFFFLAMVFFFQNQEPLSQQMTLSLNLFFIPPMTSIPLPFYFIVIAAFFVGCLMSMCFLWWDKMNASARYMRSKWRISALEKQVNSLTAQINAATQPQPEKTSSFFHRGKQSQPEAIEATAEASKNGEASKA